MKTIAVFFGGRSAEHDVSIVTALANVIKPLELTKKYKIEPIYIAKSGAWYWDSKLKDINLFTSGEIDNFLSANKPASILFDGGMTLSKGSGIRKTTEKIDIVFPAMHGTYGEDGSLMGLLEMAGVPYVGCGLSASAVSMDKALSKQVAEANGIPIAKYKTITKSAFDKNSAREIEFVNKSLIYPLFVKPAHLGSSIGITRVKESSDLQNAIEVALHYDDKAVVEQEISNLIEVTLPIIGNDDLTPALLERPLTSSEDFFDFETKYMRGGKKGGKKGGTKGAQGYSELPAKLPKDLYELAEQTGLSTYRALGCQGIARIDMLIDEKANTVYFNEVNPLPGDLYSHNWRASGISTVELVERLVKLAEERAVDRAKLNTVFSTSYLKQF